MAKDQLAQLLRDYDDYLSYGDTPLEYIYFPTSVVGLNQAFGNVKGVRSRAIMQVIGDQGRGKTTLSLEMLGIAQRQGILTDVELPNGRVINAAFADFERTFDSGYAQKLGVDTSKVYIIRTPFAEATFEILLALYNAGLKFSIVDSIAMIIPRSEDGKDMTKDNPKVAAEAQALQRFLKLAVQHVFDANGLLILINQYRANLNQMGNAPDKKAYGARAIQYVMQVSVELRKIATEVNRMRIKAFVEKSKQGAGGRAMDFDIIQGAGIDRAFHVLEMAVENEIVTKSGAWYYYHPDGNASKTNNTHHAQGKGQASNLPIDEIESKLITLLANTETQEVE